MDRATDRYTVRHTDRQTDSGRERELRLGGDKS